MSGGSKPDAHDIRGFWAGLQQAKWLGSRQWWPRFLFHFTDVQNAANILQDGCLLSRSTAVSLGHMVTDNASPDIIGQTDPAWAGYVRLYFRPRTPTQYRNEGFRPEGQRELGAHCPVPVFFLFDAESVLCRADSLFTPGSGAAHAQPLHRAVDLA